MAIAAVSCWFSALTSTGTSRYSLTSQRLFATSRKSSHFIIPQAARQDQRKKAPNKQESSTEIEVDSHRSPARSNGERPYLKADSGRTKKGRSQSIAFKSSGVQRKDSKGFLVDLKEQQVETGNLQDAAFLNAVVKNCFITHGVDANALDRALNVFQVFQHLERRSLQFTEVFINISFQMEPSTVLGTGVAFFGFTARILHLIIPCLGKNKGNIQVQEGMFLAFMIGDGKLLTNAHCVEHNTQVKVKRRGDDTKYVAKVLAKGVECDIALLSVESKGFWEGAEPLSFGRLPRLQDSVTVVGYPLGGDTISVTKGVVSRIEVTSYAHGSSELLGIQIDAAINPGNSGGPAFNDQGECIGVAFQVYRSDDVENIGYVIPTTVVSHFLDDYERNGKYTGFPCLGVLLQKLENPALRACLKVPSNEGVLVRRVEPTSGASDVLKEGDVIVSFDGVNVGCEGTVPFRSTERIAFRYLISKKFTGDVAELGIIRDGAFMKVQAVMSPRVHLVPYHIEGGQPSYLIVAGLVFTPLSEPLIDEEREDSIGLKLLAKARYSLARFKGEQIVILSQILKCNGTRIRNIHHLAHLVDSCKDKFLVFEFEDNYVAVLERELSSAASSRILNDYGIPSQRSSDLLEPYVDPLVVNDATEHQNLGDSPVSNSEFGFDGLLWA
ncbi:hypothetical protein RJ639_000420 [Escallonia herrerae]|uniref:PDZ domain-containing protein n=1 Tax=Escallonia herrerae TaxID=1293975 RepID=A0AA89BHN8_9ASTE|nr:hypothetical protein RJ639_000420 [Escallonia herrerae]